MNYIKHILLLSFIIICTQSYSQCYELTVDHIGAHAFKSDLLEPAACELIDSVSGSPSGNFKVLAYNLYPILASVDKNYGFDHTLGLLDEQLANEGNYFAIIKKINFEYDQYSLTPNQSVEFIFKYKFPENSDNVLLSELDKGALLEILHKEAAEQMSVSNNTVLTEISIMRRLATSLKGLPISENLEALDYTFIPASFDGQITGSNNNQNPNGGSEYASILIHEPNSTISTNLIGAFNNGLASSDGPSDMANLKFTTLNQGEYYDISLNVKLITSINDNVGDAFASAAALVDDQVNIHIHYDNLKQGLYFKFGFTETTANQILNAATNALMLGAGYTEWLGEDNDPIFTLKDDKDNDNERREGSVAEEWNYAKKFLMDDTGAMTSGFISVFPTEADQYAGAIACGLIDGLLSSVEMIWDLAKGVVTAGAGVIESTANYWWDVIKTGCKQGILAAGTKVGNDVIGIGTAFYENVSKAYEFIEKAYNAATPENMSKVFNFAKDAVVEWFGDITTLDAEGGYKVGKIAFEIIATFFTAGAAAGGTAAKFITKIINQLQKWELDVIAKNLSTVLRAAEDIGSQAKKVFKCKILGKGCFMKDTPVLMANNPFKNVATGMALATMPLVAPIQNVQVDDMVKSYHHEEMYLTASNDADDIYVPGWLDYDYLDITPETWQVGKFIITEDDGSLVEIEANRPIRWFEDYELHEKGDKAFIVLEEMSIADYAILQEIRTTDIDTRNFSLNEEGKVDRPVITTYKRIATEISDYTFSNGEIISCTPNHPFYSSDRQSYIPVCELTFGEAIQTASDREIKFIGGKSREKGEHVYNFEVWREHNYFVGFDGSDDFLLVHNDCLDNGAVGGVRSKLLKEAGEEFFQEVAEEVGAEVAEQAIKKGRKLTWPEVKLLFKRGNDFNKKGVAKYTNSKCEIHLGNGKRLDTYIPGEKIISRKATSIDEIAESTWHKYCKELTTKYKKGTPVNSSKMPGEPPLSGKYYLEVPASNASAAKLADYLTIAKSYGIEDIIFLVE